MIDLYPLLILTFRVSISFFRVIAGLYEKTVNITVIVEISKFEGHTFKAYNLICIERNANFHE